MLCGGLGNGMWGVGQYDVCGGGEEGVLLEVEILGDDEGWVGWRFCCNFGEIV